MTFVRFAANRSATYYEDWNSAHVGGVCRGAQKDGRGCPYCWWARYGLPAQECMYASSTAVRRPYSPRLTAAKAAANHAQDLWLETLEPGCFGSEAYLAALAAFNAACDEQAAALKEWEAS